MQRRSTSVDVVRALAALTVLGWHATLLYPLGVPAIGTDRTARLGYGLFANGDIGVQVFFVLSGWLVGGPWVRALLDGASLPSIKTHLLRRALRLLPAYWAAALAIDLAAPPVRPHGWGYLLQFSLLQWPWPSQFGAGLQDAWTLEVEVVFALLLPIAGWLLRRRYGGPMAPRCLLSWLFGLFVAGALAQTLVDTFLGNASRLAQGLDHSFLVTIGEFAPGMAIALAQAPATRRRSPRLSARAAALSGSWAAWLGIAAAVILILGLRQVPQLAVAGQLRLMRTVASGLLVLWLTGRPAPRRRPGGISVAFAACGRVSFGLYLWHYVALVVLSDQGIYTGEPWSRGGWAVNIAVTLVVSLPLALLSWALVERPAITWAHRLTTGWQRRNARPLARDIELTAARAYAAEPLSGVR